MNHDWPPHTDLPDTPSDHLPNPDYETQDRRIDRRSFLTRMGALGAAGVAAAALPVVAAKPASATSWSSRTFRCGPRR